MDDNRSGDLSFEEFKNGMTDFGLKISDEEFVSLFQLFDRDGSGTIHYDEFLRSVRVCFDCLMSKFIIKFILIQPPMNKMRVSLIEQAFAKLDKTGDGIVTYDDLKGVYNIKSNQEYLNGNKTEKQLLEDFLKKFEQEGSPDGRVKQQKANCLKTKILFFYFQLTKDEFLDYYSGVSASIDDDMYFDLMMRQSWKL